MKSVTSIIPGNLIKLRKQNGLTQIELSQKINYSDKAISRWEKGEVMPSYEVLELLASLYGVPFTYFFEEHPDENVIKLNQQTKNLYVAVLLSLILLVSTIAVLLFFTLKSLTGNYFIIIFAWAITLASLIVHFALKYWFKDRFFLLTMSIFYWTLVFTIYFQWLYLNLWQIFFIGIPAQLTIVLVHIVKKIKHKPFQQ